MAEHDRVSAGGRAIDKLIAAMRQYVGIVTMDFGMCVIRVGEDPLPPDRRQKLRRMKADLDLEFRALIRQAIAEGTIGQVQGLFSGTDFWHVNVQVEPWSDQRWSPFFGIGVGKFKNIPNRSLVGARVTDAKLATAGIGLRYHLSERFVLRADYSLYTAFVADTRSTEYRAFTAGLSFFF